MLSLFRRPRAVMVLVLVLQCVDGTLSWCAGEWDREQEKCVSKDAHEATRNSRVSAALEEMELSGGGGEGGFIAAIAGLSAFVGMALLYWIKSHRGTLEKSDVGHAAMFSFRTFDLGSDFGVVGFTANTAVYLQIYDSDALKNAMLTSAIIGTLLFIPDMFVFGQKYGWNKLGNGGIFSCYTPSKNASRNILVAVTFLESLPQLGFALHIISSYVRYGAGASTTVPVMSAILSMLTVSYDLAFSMRMVYDSSALGAVTREVTGCLLAPFWYMFCLWGESDSIKRMDGVEIYGGPEHVAKPDVLCTCCYNQTTGLLVCSGSKNPDESHESHETVGLGPNGENRFDDSNSLYKDACTCETGAFARFCCDSSFGQFCLMCAKEDDGTGKEGAQCAGYAFVKTAHAAGTAFGDNPSICTSCDCAGDTKDGGLGGGLTNPNCYSLYLSSFLCCGWFLVNPCCIRHHYSIRRDFKARYGMDGNTLEGFKTCVEASCCMPCAFRQMSRHMAAYPVKNINPANFRTDDVDAGFGIDVKLSVVDPLDPKGCTVPGTTCCANVSIPGITSPNIEETQPKGSAVKVPRAGGRATIAGRIGRQPLSTAAAASTRSRASTVPAHAHADEEFAGFADMKSGESGAVEQDNETFGGFEEACDSVKFTKKECSESRHSGSTFCAKHTCNRPGCFKLKSSRVEYCKRHKSQDA